MIILTQEVPLQALNIHLNFHPSLSQYHEVGLLNSEESKSERPILPSRDWPPLCPDN